MDLQMWLLISCLLLAVVRAEPPIQQPESNKPASSPQKPQQRYKEVIMYLTPSQIKALESGEGYIIPHNSAQPASPQDNQKQEHAYQAAQQPHHQQHQLQQQLNPRQQPQQQQQEVHHQQQQELEQHQQQHELWQKQQHEIHQQHQLKQLHQQQQKQQQEKLQQQLHQQQFQEQQDEANRKHRLHLEEVHQNQPTSLLEQNSYEQNINQQNLEQWIPQSYPQVQQQPISQQLLPSAQNDHYLQFAKSQPLPDNYAYMYFYPRDKTHGNENTELVQPNPQYNEQIKLLHLQSNSNQNLQLIEAPTIHHSSENFDQQKHKQLINDLVPNKFQLIPYDYTIDHNELLAQQHLESQHLDAHQQIKQQVNLEAQKQAHQEAQQIQRQLQHQIELESQHQLQNQIQINVQHQVLQEAQHKIQQTQHQIEQNIQLQNQQLGQLESHLQFQQTQHHVPLQSQQKPLELQTVLPQEINLKELEDHIKEHIKSQKIHSQQANEEQKAMIQHIENEKQKEIEVANMDAHHERLQIKAEQVKADELIKSGQIKAQQIEAQIVAENLETFAKIERSRNNRKHEKPQALFTSSNQPQNIIHSFNQNRQELESGFVPIASNGPDNTNNKLPKEVEQILLKNEVEKQKALIKAAEIAKEPPRVVKEEIKVIKRPQEVRVKEVRVPTPVYVPYPKPIEVKMPQPFIVPVEVIRPIPIPIVHTEKVEVEKPVPVQVNKVVHVPVTKNVYVPVDRPFIVEKIVPVEVEKKVPVPVHVNKPQKYTIIRHVWKH